MWIPPSTGASRSVDDYGYTLGGTLTVNAVNGVATFSGLTEGTAGGRYLYATGNSLSTTYTNYFTVTAACGDRSWSHIPPAVFWPMVSSACRSTPRTPLATSTRTSTAM